MTPQQFINHLSKISKYKYIAMDLNGYWYAHISKPKMIGGVEWYSNTTYILSLRNFEFDKKIKNWKESLFTKQKDE